MEIKIVEIDDYEKLVPILKQGFPKHNIFSKNDAESLQYLRGYDACDDSFGLMYIDAGVKGCIFAKPRIVTEKHTVWRLNHEVFANEDMAGMLVEEAEKMIADSEGSVKIELGLAENETDKVKLFESLGYKKEGELENHYRFGEKTILIGKTLRGA